jgi:hypothetical protein
MGCLGRRICTGVGTDALLPQAGVEEDAIDSPPRLSISATMRISREHFG